MTDKKLRDALDDWYLAALKNEWDVYWVPAGTDPEGCQKRMQHGLDLLRVAYDVCYRMAAANLPDPPAKATAAETDAAKMESVPAERQTGPEQRRTGDDT